MSTNTYVPIMTQTLGSAAASVTFSSIPQGYTDLVFVIQAGSATAEDIGMRFNSDSATNYSTTILAGGGSSASSGRTTNVTGITIDSNAYNTVNLNKNAIVHIQNYSNTTTYKTVLSRSSNASTGVDAIVGLWRSTAAINSIYLYGFNSGYQFLSGSTFTLYGIASA